MQVPAIADAMRTGRSSGLAGNGRLLVRYSGTEPLLRIMLEGKDERDSHWATRLRAPWADEIWPSRRVTSAADPAMMTKLSVNVNKVATVRNSRGGRMPSVIEAVRTCIDAGAPGITVHPRADAAAHHDRRRARDRRRAGAAQGPRRVQHRRRSAAGFSRPRARGQARSVHARAGEARRDHEPSRLARRHAAR